MIWRPGLLSLLAALPAAMLLFGSGCAGPGEVYPGPPAEKVSEADLNYAAFERAMAKPEAHGATPTKLLGYVKEMEWQRRGDRLTAWLVYDDRLQEIRGYYTEDGDTYRYPPHSDESPVYLGNYEPDESVRHILDVDADVVFAEMDWQGVRG